MSPSRAEVIAYLDGLSSLELGALIDELQRRLGLTVPVTPPVFVTMGAPVVHDDHELRVHVVLTAVGPSRLRVMQAIRERLPIGLQELVRLIEHVPATLAPALERPEADALAEQLRELGAEVTLRPAT